MRGKGAAASKSPSAAPAAKPDPAAKAAKRKATVVDDDSDGWGEEQKQQEKGKGKGKKVRRGARGHCDRGAGGHAMPGSAPAVDSMVCVARARPPARTPAADSLMQASGLLSRLNPDLSRFYSLSWGGGCARSAALSTAPLLPSLCAGGERVSRGGDDVVC